MEVKIRDNGVLKDADWTIEDGVMVVSPKGVKIDVTQFNDGDVITCGHNAFHWTCILRGKIEYIIDNMFIDDYCGINSDGTYYLEPNGSDSATWVRYATEEEKKLLFDKLSEEGFSWDAEKKELVKLKWKPIVGQHFYFVEYDNENFIFIAKAYTYAFEDQIERDKTIAKGWCFKTSKECQEFCDKLNQVINQVKP